MTESTRKSPRSRSLADRADDGFISLVRSAGELFNRAEPEPAEADEGEPIAAVVAPTSGEPDRHAPAAAREAAAPRAVVSAPVNAPEARLPAEPEDRIVGADSEPQEPAEEPVSPWHRRLLRRLRPTFLGAGSSTDSAAEPGTDSAAEPGTDSAAEPSPARGSDEAAPAEGPTVAAAATATTTAGPPNKPPARESVVDSGAREASLGSPPTAPVLRPVVEPPPAHGARPVQAMAPAAERIVARSRSATAPMPSVVAAKDRPAAAAVGRGAHPASPAIDFEALARAHPDSDRAREVKLAKWLSTLFCGSREERAAARHALAVLEPQVIEPALLALLRQPSADAVEFALDCLAAFRPDKLRGCLAAVVHSPDLEIRLRVFRVAQRMSGDEARPFFLIGSVDQAVEVRRCIVLYLAHRNEDWAREALLALCDDAEPLVSWPALRAMVNHDPALVESLISQPTRLSHRAYRRFFARLLRANPVKNKRADLLEEPNPRSASPVRKIPAKGQRSSIWPSAPPPPRVPDLQARDLPAEGGSLPTEEASESTVSQPVQPRSRSQATAGRGRSGRRT